MDRSPPGSSVRRVSQARALECARIPDPGVFPRLLLGSHVCCFCGFSVAKSCPTLCDPRDCSTPGLPVLHHLPELLRLMSIESVMPSNHLIVCHPLLLLPSVFPSIGVFSSESVVHIFGQSIGVPASTSVMPLNIQH